MPRVGDRGILYARHLRDIEPEGRIRRGLRDLGLLLFVRWRWLLCLFGRGLYLFRASAGGQSNNHRQSHDRRQELPYAQVTTSPLSTYRSQEGQEPLSLSASNSLR